MRALPLEQDRADEIATRYIQLCLEHDAPLDEGSTSCPVGGHDPDRPMEWYVWDTKAERVMGGVCTSVDGETERPVEGKGDLMAKLATNPMTEELKARIRELHAQGVPRNKIAEQLGLGYMQVFFQTQKPKGATTPRPAAPRVVAPAPKPASLVPKPSAAVKPWKPRKAKGSARPPKAAKAQGKRAKKKATKAVAIVAAPASLALPSLPAIQQDLESHKTRLLNDLRNVERAMEALALVQSAWGQAQPVAAQ